MYTVYKVTETSTGKVYVGMTKHLANRMRAHRCVAGLFYGRPHTVEALCRTENKESAIQLEQFWVARLRANEVDHGYNLHEGTKISDASRAKMSAAAKGRPSPLRGRKLSTEERRRKAERRAGKGYLRGPDHPHFGKTFDAESREKMSEAQRQRAARGDKPFLGRKHSEETKAKMRGPRESGPRPWLRKPVRNDDTGQVYDSLDAAAKVTGLHKAALSRCCLGKQHTSGGFRWSFA